MKCLTPLKQRVPDCRPLFFYRLFTVYLVCRRYFDLFLLSDTIRCFFVCCATRRLWLKSHAARVCGTFAREVGKVETDEPACEDVVTLRARVEGSVRFPLQKVNQISVLNTKIKRCTVPLGLNLYFSCGGSFFLVLTQSLQSNPYKVRCCDSDRFISNQGAVGHLQSKQPSVCHN